MKRIVLLLFLCVLASLSACSEPLVYDLSCEGMTNPLGIDNVKPHLSWKVDASCERIKAYRIQVSSSREKLEKGYADVWDSGKVLGDCTVMLPWGGPELQPAQECWWRVKVWTGARSGDWSEAARFSVGHLDGLCGDYIGAFACTDQEPVFCSSFEAEEGAEYFVHVNSLGYHELFIGGKKVGDEILSPAMSQLDRRSYIVTYDITDYVQPGHNEIAIAAAKGWYRTNTFNAFYEGPLVNAQVDVKCPDGSWQVVCMTGVAWTARMSGRRTLGSWQPWDFGGEEIDARLFGDEQDYPVEPVHIADVKAVPAVCRTNKVQEVHGVQTVEELSADSRLYQCLLGRDYVPDGKPVWIFDMGKCMVGQVEYALPELPEGAEVHAFFTDDAQTDFTGWDVLISSGKAETIREQFCFQALRYAVLTGLAEKPSADIIKVYRISQDMADASSFECSDSDMNAIHDMLQCTLRNLTFNGYQVDCPQIERMGYGGDGNSSTMTTQTMFDAAPVYMNWLAAWEDCIEEDGSLPHTAPCPYSAGGGPYWCGFPIMASYRALLNYGDPRMVERCYPLQKHWLDYVDAYTVDGLLRKWPDTERRGWYLGDWLPPHNVDATVPESIDLVNNCSLSQNLAALSDVARYLGYDPEAEAFDARRDALNKRIHEEFFHPETNTYASGSQIDMAYPMLVGAVPEECYGAVKEALKELTMQECDGHLGTGLVGVPILAEWAVKEGECEFMYGMLKQRDYPGYLYMIDNGASTTWEEWDNPRSHIHNCYNGIGSWFYQALGGLVPAFPGYRLFTIRPQIPSGIDWVRVTKETPYGTIELSWKKNGESTHYEVTIPCGTEALFSPTGAYLYAGKYSFDVNNEN